MPADPMTMLRQANLSGVDILVGSNRDEGKRGGGRDESLKSEINPSRSWKGV